MSSSIMELKLEPLPSSDTRRRSPAYVDFALVLPGLALVALVVAYPLVLSVWNSFVRQDQGQGAYAWVAENTVYLDILGQTLYTAVLTVLCCLALGYPYAYLMTVVGSRMRNVLLMVTLVPFWVSGLVRIFAWVILLQSGGPVARLLPFLGDEGILRTQLAVQIGLVQVLLPFLILPLYNTMRTIDPKLMQAAEIMGARRSIAFLRVFLPLSMPGIKAGGLVVFILTLGFYVLPQMLGSPSTAMIGNSIYVQASQLGNQGRAGALAVLLIVSAVLLIALAAGVERVWQRSGRRLVKP